VSLDQDAEQEQIEQFEQLDGADDDDPVSMLTSGHTLLGLERWVFAEQAAAEAAQRLAATPEAVESKQEADTDTAAASLIAAAAEQGLTLVTGADAARLAELARAFPAALLAAPSAAGLRTLAQAGADPVDARVLAQDPGRIASADVLIVADAQLAGVELAATLLECARDGAHVVLAGDPVTLPSTAPGMVFRDLLEIDDPEFGGKLPRVELKQRPTGPLSALADAVRHGGLPPQELLLGADGASKEVVIVPVREAAEAVHRAVQVAADSIPRAFGLSGYQVQVVTVDGGPASDAGAGVKALNAALKARLNPGPGAYAGFDVGDRVIVITPLPEQGLFGGETGTVRHAEAGALTIGWDRPHDTRRMPTEPAEPAEQTEPTEPSEDAPADQAPETRLTGDVPAQAAAASSFIAATQVRALRHAWALTIAEAQGGRWPAVVAVFDAQSAPRLSRAVMLGAIVSATQHLTVIHGAGRALADAVEKMPHRPRRTRLTDALRQ
ncbi:MAG: AAA family ATPase, partial [Actinocrinis sp.]